jgi:hypothetical protein
MFGGDGRVCIAVGVKRPAANAPGLYLGLHICGIGSEIFCQVEAAHSKTGGGDVKTVIRPKPNRLSFEREEVVGIRRTRDFNYL